MRRIILIIVFSSVLSTVKAQINNLNDLLEVSELSVYGLTSKLQYSWKLSQPTQQIKGKTITSRHTYSFPSNNQILQRIIKLNHNTNTKIESTSFVCNDNALLKRVLRSLPYKGFEKKTEEDNVTLYDDGNIILSLQIGASDDISLSDGYYRIVIVN